MKAAVEYHFSGPTGSLTSYTSSITSIGTLLRQASGSNVEDNFISTKPAAIVNIPELFTGATSQQMPHIYKWSNNIYWIFVTQVAAAATRQVVLFEFNSTTQAISYKGFVTVAGTTILGNRTTRALRAFVYEHTTGTVSTTGASTTINGSSTGFQSERIAVGARIGFGTTDPTQVTTWYEITAITNDTTLTINSPVTLSGGTSYVIEEIRIAIGATNATVVNGGVYLVKGLNYDTFTPSGTSLVEATTVDNIRASYFLTDGFFSGSLGSQTFTLPASTTATASFTASAHGLTNGDTIVLTSTGAVPTGLTLTTTTATVYYVVSASTNNFNVSTALNGAPVITTGGSNTGTHTMHHYASRNIAALAADDMVSFTDHPLYVVSNIGGVASTILKYNIRAALTVGALGTVPNIASGTSPSAFQLKTSTLAVTGAPSQTNSGRVFTVAHGPASGSKSVYFATNSRIYQCPISNITAASVNWQPNVMQEVPPGGLSGGAGTTYTVLGTMAQVDYSSTIDRIFVTNTGGRFGVYVGQFTTDNTAFDKLIGTNLNRVRVSGTPAGATDGLFPQAVMSIWTEDGWMFAVPSITTAAINWLYVFPFGADSFYESISNQYVITPKLATPNATKLYSVYVDHMEYAGTYGLGFPVETYRLWYRTTGIDDNSGAWTEIPVGADLTNVAPGDYIQFKIAFDIMGEICVPTRIYSIAVLYEDGSQDSHYEPSLTKSSAQNRQFAWRQIISWGGTIPNLRLRLFNTANGATVLDDTVTANTYGTWEYSTDGTNWSAWSSSADTIGNYIRYTAGDGVIGNLITVRALLTQA